jgi:uridine phosphorylase
MGNRIEESELILNADGSVFHLHLKPGEIANDIILVGDPDRVELIAGYFSKIEVSRKNREFVSKTGIYNGKRISVVATGIGTDNVDIVVNELDALVNVDFQKREVREQRQSLNFVRIGTSGSLQRDIPVDSYVVSTNAVGFDGMLNFYKNIESVSNLQFEAALIKHLSWNPRLTTPYVVAAGEKILSRIKTPQMIEGVTISAPGFYGPQGRVIRLAIQDEQINNKIASFRFNDLRITNYEMECSAIYGLSALMGHQAATVCAIIANRQAGQYSKDYHPVVKNLIEVILQQLTK